MKKNALIIGGAGFIGHHLANYLTLKNFNVGVLDNLSSGKKKQSFKKKYFLLWRYSSRQCIKQNYKKIWFDISLSCQSRATRVYR